MTRGRRRPLIAARVPAASAPDGGGTPDEPAPGAAHPAHQVLGGQALAEGDGDDGSGADGETDQGEGGAGQLPALRHRHDQVAHAGEQRRTR